jgi:TRAP-type C4-dicarboxylate transport system permease large subunit
VFLAQLGVAMLVWIAVIVMLVRSRDRLMDEMRARSRGTRTRQALLRLLASLLCVVLVMMMLAQGGLTATGFTVLGWLVTVILGAGFIVLQTTALVPLVLNAATPVTRPEPRASDKEDAPRP